MNEKEQKLKISYFMNQQSNSGLWTKQQTK